MEDIINVCTNIKYERLMKGMTIAELSKKSGISSVTLSNIENQKIEDIKLSSISKIASALDVPIGEIVTDNKLDSNNEKDVERDFQKDMDQIYPVDNRRQEEKNKSPVCCLSEFLPYLPLIEKSELNKLHLDNIQTGWIGHEDEILEKLNELIRSIPPSPEKDYADQVVAVMQKGVETRDFKQTMQDAEKISDKGKEMYNSFIGKQLGIGQRARDFIEAYNACNGKIF